MQMKVPNILATALACSVLSVSAERPADISVQNAEIILLEDATAYSFRTNGTLTVSEPGSIDVLVVGGGGCGGTTKGGGGGGGGVLYRTNCIVSAGVYDVIVGNGAIVGGAQAGSSSVFGFVAQGVLAAAVLEDAPKTVRTALMSLAAVVAEEAIPATQVMPAAKEDRA